MSRNFVSKIPVVSQIFAHRYLLTTKTEKNIEKLGKIKQACNLVNSFFPDI